VSPPTVFLHVGTPKSATSYLQSRFEVNAARAAEQGLLWPGPDWDTHVRAARDLWRLPEGQRLDPGGAWSLLARQARGWSGHAVLVSMEWLASCTGHQVAAAVGSLAPCRVEVICTARDLGRNFTAQWQEMMKNYRPWTWQQYVGEITGQRPGPARRHFWRQQDVPGVLERWLRAVPAERVHLVTVPPAGSDPELLWSRFCAVLGIEGCGFAPATRKNVSLGVVSTVLMRHLNVAARAHGLPHRRYQQLIQDRVGREVLAAAGGGEDPIAVSAQTAAWIEEQAARATARIEDLGVDVVGDLHDLVPTDRPPGREPGEVTDTELLRLCAHALVRLGASQQEEITRLHDELAQARAQPTGPHIPPSITNLLKHTRLGSYLARQRRAR